VALQDRVDEGEVRRERDDRGMHDRVVAEGSTCSKPQQLAVVQLAVAAPGQLGHEADLEAVRLGVAVRRDSRVAGRPSRRVEALRAWRVGGVVLVDETGLVGVEGALEVEDRLAPLDGDDPTRRERTSVTDPVDFVDDRAVRVARSEEVRVEGVDPAALDRTTCRDERLRGDLAAEDPKPAVVDAHAPEDVELDRLEVEQVEQLVRRRAHRDTVHFGAMSPGSSSRLERAREFRRTPAFATLWRYAAVSVISTVLTEVLLYLFFRVAKVGSAAESNALAAGISTVPSYYLNRTWAWGKTGRSHVMREVVPFWTIAAVSLVLSTIAVGAADSAAKASLHSHTFETLAVLGANIGTYAVIWVGKFILFNKVLFVIPPTEPAGPTAG